MEKETYNGWSNYATWRVNLELVDGTQFVREDITRNDEQELTIDDIASFLRDNVVEGALDEARHTEGVPSWIVDYAEAFLVDVNWHEIAEHFAEDYPDIMRTDTNIEQDNAK